MFVSEAAAQLPVRTRSLVMLSTATGQITQNSGAMILANNYAVTWPAIASPVLANHKSFLYADALSTATQQNLGWFDVLGDLVDNNGNLVNAADAGQVTYWADDNSVTGELGFLWDELTNTLTLGEAAEPGEIRFRLGVAGVNPGTLNTAVLTNPITYTLPNLTAGSFAVNIPVSTNLPDIAVADQILLSNTSGSARWATNPFAGVERGVEDPTDGNFTHTVTLVAAVDATPLNDVILVTPYDITGTPNGNILSVTARGPGNSFIVSASGPFSANERIAYLFIPVP